MEVEIDEVSAQMKGAGAVKAEGGKKRHPIPMAACDEKAAAASKKDDKEPKGKGKEPPPAPEKKEKDKGDATKKPAEPEKKGHRVPGA